MPRARRSGRPVTAPLVARPRDVGLVQGDHDARQLVGDPARGARLDPLGEPVGDDPGEHLGGGVQSGERPARRRGCGRSGRRAPSCSASAARPMSTTIPSASSSGPRERRVDDVRRAVQPLRRPEHLAAKAVGDHHVVADGHGEHQRLLAVRRSRSCGTAPVSVPSASRGHHLGQLARTATRPVSSASNAGSRSSSSASAQPVGVAAAAPAGRRDGPTWLARMREPARSGTRRRAAA